MDDPGAGQATLIGEGFGTNPIVEFGDFGLADVVTATDTMIIIDLPTTDPGDYLVLVTAGIGGGDDDDSDSDDNDNGSAHDEYDLTLGAVGPQGDQGDQGEPGTDGEQGPPGEDGEDGAEGQPGATSLSCTRPSKNMPAGGSIGTLGQVTVDCGPGEIVTGGGFDIDDFNDTFNWNRAFSKPASSTSWTCGRDISAATSTCFAVCCKLQ